MSKRNSYVLIAILLIIGVYFFEFYLEDKEEKEVFQQGIEVKEDTSVLSANEYYRTDCAS